MPSVRRPWITWTDGILSVLIVVSIMTMSWLSYRAGCYSETEWIWLSFILLMPPFLSGLFLLFLPWIMLPSSIQWHQFWIRPALFVGIALCVSRLWSLNLFNEPGVSSFLSGCRDAVRYTVSQEDIEKLRRIAAERVRQGNSSEDSLRLSADQLPPSFHRCSWGEPRLELLQPHRRGVEIDVFWGGTLPGWFGLKIDPEELPEEGLTEPFESAFRWHYKLSEGVYFFHTNG
jgi:hypothetical protein